jgi:hypothetical protein
MTSAVSNACLQTDSVSVYCAHHSPSVLAALPTNAKPVHLFACVSPVLNQCCVLCFRAFKHIYLASFVCVHSYVQTHSSGVNSICSPSALASPSAYVVGGSNIPKGGTDTKDDRASATGMQGMNSMQTVLVCKKHAGVNSMQTV